MNAILIRHAEAVDETLALRDPNRHLTARGREQARALGARLREIGCEPTQVWTSPLVRALQTAELVAAGLGSRVAVEVMPDLSPDGTHRDIVAAVRALPPGHCVVLVGHEPSMSAIGGLLVGARDFEVLHKAQAVRLADGVRIDADAAPRGSSAGFS